MRCGVFQVDCIDLLEVQSARVDCTVDVDAVVVGAALCY